MMNYSWKDAPTWAMYVAMDANGILFWHENEPEKDDKEWLSSGKMEVVDNVHPEWQTSMESRFPKHESRVCEVLNGCNYYSAMFLKNKKQPYAATEMAYISRGLKDEPELLELCSPKNIKLYKEVMEMVVNGEDIDG